MNFYILAMFFSANLYANSPYNVLDSTYVDGDDVYEVFPMSPVKSQDGLGFCYGFSATSLLENYRCRELNLNCNGPENLLSSLDVTSYYKGNKLLIGGRPEDILSNIQTSNRKIAKEECADFSRLVGDVNFGSHIISEESVGWEFLVNKWNEYKGISNQEMMNDCVSCLADSIRNNLTNLATPLDQLKSAFITSGNLDDFLYKAVMPAECFKESNLLSIPNFVAKSYPTYNEIFSKSELEKKIENLLISNIPLEISICADGESPCGKDNNGEGIGHSITLFGIKEVCSIQNNDCKKVVKVKNSYGMSWQRQNNDGWVEMDSIINASANFDNKYNITWIEKPNFVLPDVRLAVTKMKKQNVTLNSNNKVPNNLKDYKGMWKCPGMKFQDTYAEGCVPLRK